MQGATFFLISFTFKSNNPGGSLGLFYDWFPHLFLQGHNQPQTFWHSGETWW